MSLHYCEATAHIPACYSVLKICSAPYESHRDSLAASSSTAVALLGSEVRKISFVRSLRWCSVSRGEQARQRMEDGRWSGVRYETKSMRQKRLAPGSRALLRQLRTTIYSVCTTTPLARIPHTTYHISSSRSLHSALVLSLHIDRSSIWTPLSRTSEHPSTRRNISLVTTSQERARPC